MSKRQRFVLATLASVSIACVCLAQGGEPNRFWAGIKRTLAGPEGTTYFETSLKGALLPRLRGSLISAIVRDGLSKLTLGITEANTPEVTLIYHTGNKRVKGDPEPGTQIEFAGVGTEFTKEPFMLTLEVEVDWLLGLELEQSKSPPKGSSSKK
jgi:hypothetical protein